MKVAVVHNRSMSGVINQFGQLCPEKYGEKAIVAVLGALQRAGHDVLLCEGDKTLLQVLERFMQLCFGVIKLAQVFVSFAGDALQFRHA